METDIGLAHPVGNPEDGWPWVTAVNLSSLSEAFTICEQNDDGRNRTQPTQRNLGSHYSGTACHSPPYEASFVADKFHTPVCKQPRTLFLCFRLDAKFTTTMILNPMRDPCSVLRTSTCTVRNFMRSDDNTDTLPV
ncbi:hypothetical protein I7I50_12366 [Histoplasma capsulatum G186AR]|uniref:Uncharacterized protein n=1 Tax=Ajellomyces capsulatus TaxID=5037 RepID=A0A8H8CST8_AJECA|nr:hypothetical protein I7I52_11322 [Histoplasma capsulatum]QSS70663.1 hypothetical protein I7I50_12366 [Histoplasma capsulatum G186AR]